MHARQRGRTSAQQFGEILSDFAGETAKALNERGLPSPRGGKWTARSIINVCPRLATRARINRTTTTPSI